ncbi:MAG: hypothetical protein GY821_01560 [Gammaproteobacteria bacterium]|nr:hypothetical protein [Gammaproteobacteria bacterium]
MTIAQQLEQKGLQKGLQEGELQGLQKGRRETAQNLLTEGACLTTIIIPYY